MLKKTAITLCAMLMFGCAAKTGNLEMMPVPEDGTREALLPTYQPTGSACLDSIVVNMLYVGCSFMSTAHDDDGIIYMGCIQPQPGAQDVFSTGTFLRITDPTQLPGGAQPFCGDPTGVYAMWSVPFTELIRDD